MTTELATRDNLIHDINDLRQVAQLLLASNYFTTKNSTPEGRLSEIATKVMAGQEIGFKPFASAKGIHIVQGAPTIGGNLMAAAVKASKKYDYRIRQMDNDACKIEFFERVGGKLESLGVSEFTSADAKTAGTQNMAKFPRNMLFNRAISNGVRWFCPDVFEGVAVYTPEEMGAEVDSNGDVVEGSCSPVSQPVSAPAPATVPAPDPIVVDLGARLTALANTYGAERVVEANGGKLPATIADITALETSLAANDVEI